VSKYNHQVGSIYMRRNEGGWSGKVTFDIRCVITVTEIVKRLSGWTVIVDGEEIKVPKKIRYGIFTVTVYPNKIIVKTDEVQRSTMDAWARKNVEINNLEYLVRSGRTVISTLRNALERYSKNKHRYKVEFDPEVIRKIIDDLEESID